MIAFKLLDPIPSFCAGIVEARGLKIQPSNTTIQRYCARVIASVTEHGVVGGDLRLRAVRDLLRTGGYKPAGRGKPAQEYLLRTAFKDGRLPTILNAVDLINVVSLCSGLPISLLSVSRLGPQFSIRYGREGESYVFNASEQTLDLKGLICVCAESEGASNPVGSPVKDSMRGKVTADDTDMVAIVYGSLKTASRDEMRHWATELAQRFEQWCEATEVSQQVLSEADYQAPE